MGSGYISKEEATELANGLVVTNKRNQRQGNSKTSAPGNGGTEQSFPDSCKHGNPVETSAGDGFGATSRQGLD